MEEDDKAVVNRSAEKRSVLDSDYDNGFTRKPNDMKTKSSFRSGHCQAARGGAFTDLLVFSVDCPATGAPAARKTGLAICSSFSSFSSIFLLSIFRSTCCREGESSSPSSSSPSSENSKTALRFLNRRSLDTLRKEGALGAVDVAARRC